MIKTFIIAAQSLDGFIGPITHTNSMSWTSGADKTFFKDKTKEAGVVIMGRTTFETIGKALPDRKTIVYSSDPILSEGIETTRLSPQDLLLKLEKEGYSEVAICGGASIYSMFLKENLVDKIYLTLEPLLFGEGIPLCPDIQATHLELISSTPLDSNALLLEYNIKK
jgi:dihydrofolate reductase